MGRPQREFTPAQREAIAQAYTNGSGLRELGETYRTDGRIIRRVLDEMGVAIRPGGAPAREPCGTDAGAQRHRRKREPVCAACLEAHRSYDRDYYQTHQRPPRTRATS